MRTLATKEPRTPITTQMKLDLSYFRGIVAGLKHQTTRRGILHFHAGDRIRFTAGSVATTVEVTGQHFRTLDSLSQLDAERDGFANVTEMQLALLHHYPGLSPSDVLTCIRFRKDTTHD